MSAAFLLILTVANNNSRAISARVIVIAAHAWLIAPRPLLVARGFSASPNFINGRTCGGLPDDSALWAWPSETGRPSGAYPRFCGPLRATPYPVANSMRPALKVLGLGGVLVLLVWRTRCVSKTPNGAGDGGTFPCGYACAGGFHGGMFCPPADAHLL